MNAICVFLALISFSLSSTPPVTAAPSPMLRILTCEEAPTNYMEDGRVTGITTDIVRELRRRTNSQGKIKLLPWPRAYQIALNTPNVVLFTAGRTPQRENLFQWVGPVFVKRWVMLARRGSNYKINSLADMRAVKRIVVLKDDARDQLLKREGFTNIIEVGSQLQAVRMLARGRADLWPSSDMEGAVIAQKAGIPFQDLEVVFVLKKINPAIIISRQTPHKIVVAWQDALQTMVDDGTMARIGRTWSEKLRTPIQVRNRVLVFGENNPSQGDYLNK